MRRLLLGLLFALFATAAEAVCPPSLLLQDASGVQAPAQYLDNGGGLCVIVVDTGPTGNLINALKSSIPAGNNNIGSVSFAAGTAFGATPGHVLTIASNNSTNIKPSAGILYSITVTQTTTTLGDLRLYDTGTAPTCSSASGVVANFAVQSNAVTPGFSLNFGAAGLQFNNGISFCLTGAIADNDNTNFVTGVQVNYSYK